MLYGSQGWCDRRGAGAADSCKEVAAQALETALADSRPDTALTGASWRWGDAHPALLAHRPFEQVPLLRDWFSRLVPVGGDGATVNVASPGLARPDVPFGCVSRGWLPGDL